MRSKQCADIPETGGLENDAAPFCFSRIFAMIRTYSELIRLPTFSERLRYLELHGSVGRETFGTDRWINQAFYSSGEWKQFRWEIILRDNGCDLGLAGYEITDIKGSYGKVVPARVVIHHMNPIVVADIKNHDIDRLMNPEYMITVSESTHRAIHYGGEKLLLSKEPADRKPNDTCPWKTGGIR